VKSHTPDARGSGGSVRHDALMRTQLTRDAELFARHTDAFLAVRAERNVLATVLLRARRAPADAQTPLFAYTLDHDDAVVAAAMRLPPWPMLASDFDGAAADDLLDLWIAEDPGLPGVNAQPATARAIATAWERHTGGRASCRMREAMHSLTEVRDPPRPARGRLRRAQDSERELLIAWEEAFCSEAGVGVPGQAARSVQARLQGGGLFVWDDGGPVMALTLSPTIAGVARIGPVYTPLEKRRRGYASSAVAAVSRLALGADAHRCMLFTDLANPTSNKIYASVGYERFADWEDHAFQPRDRAATRA
jgi:RimJ/RimL family protein N-acetyltransferase